MICAVVLCAAQPTKALVVSEIMYHPVEEGGTPSGDETLEFIELYNNQATSEDLSGFAFTNGIEYTFPAGTVLAGKGYLVLAHDPDAVKAAYGISVVYGPFTGRLNNDGERIELSSANGAVIISFRYNDARPWPISPDGTGHSLILAKLGGDPEDASSWAASTYIGGTPGGPDEAQVWSGVTGTVRARVVINELLANSDAPPGTDWIELYNPGPIAVDLSSIYLSDGRFQLLQYKLPAGVLQPGQFLTIREGTPPSGFPFALSWSGETIFLTAATNDPSPSPIRVLDVVRFGAVEPDITIGRFPDGSDYIDSLSSPTFNAANVKPLIRDIVINEIMYHHPTQDNRYEYVELYNKGTSTIPLTGWAFTDGIEYEFGGGISMLPGSYLVVAKDQDFLKLVYNNLVVGTNLVGPFTGSLDDHSERVRLSCRFEDPETHDVNMVTVDEVTYYDGGRWPNWADGQGASMELRDPGSNNDTPDAWADSNETAKSTWQQFSFTINSNDSQYTHDQVTVFDVILLNCGEMLLDDLELIIGGSNRLSNNGFENGETGWRLLGNHTRSFVTTEDHHSGSQSLHLIATGHGDPGANRVNQSITGVTAGTVTFRGWAKWLRGSQFLLLRVTRANSPVMPPRPAYSFELGTPLNMGTPGLQNTAYVPNRGPDILEVRHSPVIPTANEPIVVTARVIDNDGVGPVDLYYRSEGGISGIALVDIGHQGRYFKGTTEPSPGAGGIPTTAWTQIGFNDEPSTTAWLNGDNGYGYSGSATEQQFIKTTLNMNGNYISAYARLRFTLTAEQINSYSQLLAEVHYDDDYVLYLNGTRVADSGGLSGDPPPYSAGRGTGWEPPVANVDLTSWMKLLVAGVNVLAIQFHNNAISSSSDAFGAPILRAVPKGGVGGGFVAASMLDNGTEGDSVAGDGIYSATIPGATGGTMRAFYIEASDGSVSTRFPTVLEPSADVPNRTCLVRVGDTLVNTRFAAYRVWLSNDVINTFRSRPNLSNELMDCTFVYNNTEVFYNCGIRYRGSPFIRSGSGRDPRDRYGFRLNFNADQRFRGQEEINLDNTEGGNRGPLQERASYWFYRQMGLQFSMQEFVRLVINGNNHANYEDVQNIEGNYIDMWFADDSDGYMHKIDDYFEYSADGTGFANIDEGLHYDSRHPLLKETYRWHFEKRGHREDDNWDHFFDFAKAMNTPSSSPNYEQAIESVIHPEHFARILAIRHAVGDWDSYGYRRGKNNYFYYAPLEDKWYLLPWDIDFTLGSGDGAGTSLFSIGGQFPEVAQFLNYPKYRRMYLQAMAELANGPWQTSYGTANPPTAFDRFLDDAANALIADGGDAGRRDGIKQFVLGRRAYILTQIPSMVFMIVTNNGDDFCTSTPTVTIVGLAPLEVAGISVNGTPLPAGFSGNNVFTVNVPLAVGPNLLTVVGLNGVGNPVPGATDSITVARVPPCAVTSVTPNPVCNNSTAHLAIHGSGFVPGSTPTVVLTSASEEIGFDTLYVQSNQAFDRIDAATLLLDDPTRGVGAPVRAVHQVINLLTTSDDGVFPPSERFAPPFGSGDPSNFAVRFTGYIYAPSPGVRYFGVNSDDGFSLWIDGKLVGQYADPRGPATTDCLQNRTAGTMTFNFPAAGTYYMVLDFYENSGGEEIEFFQTNSTGGDQRLINVNAELVVFRDNVKRIDATNVVVADENTVVCQVDLKAAEPGTWNVIVTPACGETSRCILDDGLQIVACSYDFNHDSQINLFDLAQLANKWQEACSEPLWCAGIDLDHSGRVSIGDLAIFAQAWLLAANPP